MKGGNSVVILKIWDQMWVVSTWYRDAVDQNGKTDVQICVRVWIVVVYWSFSWNWEMVQTIRKYGTVCKEQKNGKRESVGEESVGDRMNKLSEM